MIEEAYVSFEVAKLLKDKGFDEICSHFYRFDSKELYYGTPYTNSQVGDKIYNSPTQQMAARWLREVHNIHIVIHPYTDMAGHHFTYLFDKYSHECWQELAIYLLDSYSSYEKALEAGIQYCLKELIN